MSERDAIWQERRLEEILYSSADDASKAQQIIRLGFEPEIADQLVERHQLGADTPVYYETLRPGDLNLYGPDELDDEPIEG